MVKRTICILIALIIICILPAAAFASDDDIKSDSFANGKYSDVYDLEGCRLGAKTGTNIDVITAEYIDAEIEYYDSYPDQALALKQGKIDGFLCDEPSGRVICNQNSEIGVLDELYEDIYGFATSKTERGNLLCDQLNEFILKCDNDGTLSELKSKWYGNDDSVKYVDIPKSGENGQIVLGTDLTAEPCDYLKDSKPVGYEIDLMAMFCREYGYGLEITDTQFSSLIPGLESGKYDVVCSMMSITDERKKKVNMTEPACIGGILALTLKEDIIGFTEPEYSNCDQLSGKNIGVISGTIQEKYTKELIDNPNILYYDAYSDLEDALALKEIDAFIAESLQYQIMKENNDAIAAVDNPVVFEHLGAVFSETESGQKYLREFNDFLKQIKKDGRYEKLNKIWLSSDTSDQEPGKLEELDGTNGVIKFASPGLSYPYSFFIDGVFSGFECDLLYEFCKEYGYSVDFESPDFTDTLAGVISGTYDMAMSCIARTDEREEILDFSDDYSNIENLLVSRAVYYGESVSDNNTVFNQIADSFYSNFILENRWQLILSGLGVTVLLAVVSIVGGTALGFGMYNLRVCRFSGLRAFEKGYIKVIQGIPVVVLLMILYYVAFAGVTIDAIIVGCIGFSINFSAFVAEIIRSSAESIGAGQWDAACALGFDRKMSFRKVILPQIINQSLPVYKGDCITLLKATSVAGYISVMDLTKVADIIRSRTFDAFFPLIVTGVIYFVLALLLAKLLSAIEIKTDPKKRRNILKNIKPFNDSFSDGSMLNTDDKGKPVLSISHLSKEYNELKPLKDINAKIKSGDVIAVIGPSGTGKSTLLRCINRLEDPSSGSIIAFGEDTMEYGYDLCKMRSKIGMVFQSFNLFGHLTIIENIMLAPVIIKKMDKQEAYNRGMGLLMRVGLLDKALSYPEDLSGGQQQRVAIVRALAMEPKMILFDEPTSALDPAMTGEVRAVIRGLAEQGLTMMIVTHEMKLARNVADRVFYLDQGVIYEEGTPEKIFENPERDLTRAFINTVKYYRYDIDSNTFDFIAMRNNVIQFCMEQFVSRNLTNALVHIIEEIVMHGLFVAEHVYPACISIEYGQDSGLLLSVKYFGRTNIMDNMDEISLSVIKNFASDIQYENEGLDCKVSFKIS